MSTTDRVLLKVKKCPVCQREFSIVCSPEEWVYKINEKRHPKYYCRWSCMRKAELEKEEKLKKNSRRKVKEP